MSPASGGPYLPQNYSPRPRPADRNPGDVQPATRVAGHSAVLETESNPSRPNLSSSETLTWQSR